MNSVDYTAAAQIAVQIKQRRKLLRLTQAELAQQAGTSQTAIARLEAAQGNPTLAVIQRLSTALNLKFILTVHPESPKTEPAPNWLKP